MCRVAPLWYITGIWVWRRWRGTAPPQLTSKPPRETLVRQVREHIDRLLAPSVMHALRDSIINQTGGQVTAAEGLVPTLVPALIDSLDCLHFATKDCLQQHPQHSQPIQEMARKILGWLVVLAVDHDYAYETGLAFNPWQNGLQYTVPLQSETAVEVVMSSLGGRHARFRLEENPQKRVRVVGKDSFTVDEIETGFGYSDQVMGIVRRIWMHLKKDEWPLAGSEEEELRELRAMLRGRQRRKESHYYITIPPQQEQSARAHRVVLSRLLEALPPLRVIYVGGARNAGLLVVDEDELWEAIKAFLELTRGTP